MSLRLLVLLVALIADLGTAAHAMTAADIKKARPLSTEEVYQLYNSRSWLWNAGAGFFSVKQRRFTAWSREGGVPSYAIGHWFPTNGGKLCFRATWYAASGSSRALSCFSHRELHGAIYQKREPDGEWYLFRSGPPRSRDEWRKLRRGDYVVSRLDRIRAGLVNR